MLTMKSVQIEQYSEDTRKVRVVEAPVPEPGPGQVRVRMRMAAINPSDFNFIRGTYRAALERLIWNRGQTTMCFDPQRRQVCPEPPYALGNEGVGVVDACGSGWLARRLAGRRVAIAAGPPAGCWQEYTVVDARKAVPVPDTLDDAQAAMLLINPLSACAMVHDLLRVRRGEWLIQDAAGSALAAMVIRLGRRSGFRTINVVGSAAHDGALQALGADAIIDTSRQDLLDEVARITDGRGADCALDCVGGELGATLLRSLGRNGRMVVYGTLGDAPIPLPSRDLMMPCTTLQGFYAGGWLASQSPLRMLWIIRRLLRLSAAGVFDTTVAATYTLGRVQEALEAARQPGRPGKILLAIG
jgi:NADPH2:quinone reductase